MIAALVSFKSPLATRPMTSTRSSSRLLMAVLFNQTSSGWRSQSKGTFLISSEGDIIIKFQHSYVRVPSWPTVVARAGTLASTLSERGIFAGEGARATQLEPSNLEDAVDGGTPGFEEGDGYVV